MTAAAAVAAPANPGVRVQDVEVNLIAQSPVNPRTTIDPESLRHLRDSIGQHGIQVPVLLRPRKLEWLATKGLGHVWYLSHKKPGGHNIIETFSNGKPEEQNKHLAETAAAKKNGPEVYELIAGQRRLAAAKMLKLETVPSIIREMTDDEAREIALIDNLQREDVPALEEATVYEALRQQLGTAEAIAARVGKPVEYIAKRLRLVALGELQRKALAERLITVDHALLLARLGVEEQDANLKWCLDVNAGIKTTLAAVITDVTKRKANEHGRYGYWQPQSVLNLKNHIERHAGRALAKAPWDLADAKLVPAAGACESCPSNTAHNTSLFADLAIEAATCEDGKCFEAKRDQYVRIQAMDANAQYRLSWKISEAAPRMLKDGSGVNPHVVLRYGQWIDAKAKSCPDVVRGVTVDWDDHAHDRGPGTKRQPGEVLNVCVTAGCKTHVKAFEKKATQQASGRRHDPKAEEAMLEKNSQLHLAENRLRIAYVSAALEAIQAIPAGAIRALAGDALPQWEGGCKPYHALLPGIVKVLQTAKTDSVEFARAVTLASISSDELQVTRGNYQDQSQYGRAELIKAVRGLGYNGVTPWDELEAAKPKPAAKKAAAKKAPAKKAAAKKAAKKKAVKR